MVLMPARVGIVLLDRLTLAAGVFTWFESSAKSVAGSLFTARELADEA
jgi:hypothetical protein